MQRLPSDSIQIPFATEGDGGRFIYVAAPWTPVGGGMYKVTDYLIQSQAQTAPGQAAQLRPLDTRGGGSALSSLWVTLQALTRIVRGRLSGRLAGVHVNMAERLSFLRKSVVVAVCRALGVPVIVHLHAAQLHHSYRKAPAPLQALTRWVFSLPGMVIVLGTAARRFVVEELRVPPERVEIVINGVPEPAVVRADRPAAPEAARILFLGNLSERKGVSDLLHALSRPEMEALAPHALIGGGGDIEQYRAKAASLGVAERTEFLGWCDQDQVATLMAQADVLILPSYDEGLPLVILEALAHGLPVICTPVGEIGSVLEDGIHACFVQPGDVDGIAAALQKVLSDPKLRETLSENGRSLYEQRFSLPRFFSSIAQLHQRQFGVAALPRQPRAETAP